MSSASARQLLDDIRITAVMLLDFPEMGRTRDDLSPGLQSIVSDPLVVFYRVGRRDRDRSRTSPARRH
jgi:plasmid stabilization system protein ParE